MSGVVLEGIWLEQKFKMWELELELVDLMRNELELVCEIGKGVIKV